MEDETYHVIGDVHAESSSFVVHKSSRVDSESRYADVQHVAVLRWQRKGWSRERRFLMLPDVVELALSKGKKNSMMFLITKLSVFLIISCKLFFFFFLPSTSS